MSEGGLTHRLEGFGPGDVTVAMSQSLHLIRTAIVARPAAGRWLGCRGEMGWSVSLNLSRRGPLGALTSDEVGGWLI